MRTIEGTATITIDKLDNLRQHEQWYNELWRDVSKLVKEIDSVQYNKKMKEIDNTGDISDEEVDRLVKEAEGTLKIIVSERIIRKLIREHIDEEKSSVHYVIGGMTEEEISKIPIVLESAVASRIALADKEIQKFRSQVGSELASGKLKMPEYVTGW